MATEQEKLYNSKVNYATQGPQGSSKSYSNATYGADINATIGDKDRFKGWTEQRNQAITGNAGQGGGTQAGTGLYSSMVSRGNAQAQETAKTSGQGGGAQIGAGQGQSQAGIPLYKPKENLYGQQLEEYQAQQRRTARNQALQQNQALRNATQQTEAGGFDFGSENALAIQSQNQAVANQSNLEANSELFNQRQNLLSQQKAEQQNLINMAPSEKARAYLTTLMSQNGDVQNAYQSLYDSSGSLAEQYRDPTETEVALQSEAERLLANGQAQNMDEAMAKAQESNRIQYEMEQDQMKQFQEQKAVDEDVANKIATAKQDPLYMSELAQNINNMSEYERMQVINAITEQAQGIQWGGDSKFKLSTIEKAPTNTNNPILNGLNSGAIQRGVPIMVEGKPYVFTRQEYKSRGGFGAGSAYDDHIYIYGIDPQTGEEVKLKTINVDD